MSLQGKGVGRKDLGKPQIITVPHSCLMSSPLYSNTLSVPFRERYVSLKILISTETQERLHHVITCPTYVFPVCFTIHIGLLFYHFHGFLSILTSCSVYHQLCQAYGALDSLVLVFLFCFFFPNWTQARVIWKREPQLRNAFIRLDYRKDYEAMF